MKRESKPRKNALLTFSSKVKAQQARHLKQNSKVTLPKLKVENSANKD